MGPVVPRWAPWRPHETCYQGPYLHVLLTLNTNHLIHGVVTCTFINYMEWHDDVIKWKHFPRYWPFVRGIHRSPVNSPHKGQWRGALMFSLVCVWINGWVNNREAGDLIRQRSHYDVTVMVSRSTKKPVWGVTRNHSARWWTILVSCPTDPECKT